VLFVDTFYPRFPTLDSEAFGVTTCYCSFRLSHFTLLYANWYVCSLTNPHFSPQVLYIWIFATNYDPLTSCRYLRPMSNSTSLFFKSCRYFSSIVPLVDELHPFPFRTKKISAYHLKLRCLKTICELACSNSTACQYFHMCIFFCDSSTSRALSSYESHAHPAMICYYACEYKSMADYSFLSA
jgi:hypothetical protein